MYHSLFSYILELISNLNVCDTLHMSWEAKKKTFLEHFSMPARKCILIISAYARTPTHLSFPPQTPLSKREKTRTILDSKHAVVRDFDHLFVANPSLLGREKKMAFYDAFYLALSAIFPAEEEELISPFLFPTSYLDLFERMQNHIILKNQAQFCGMNQKNLFSLFQFDGLLFSHTRYIAFFSFLLREIITQQQFPGNRDNSPPPRK